MHTSRDLDPTGMLRTGLAKADGFGGLVACVLASLLLGAIAPPWSAAAAEGVESTLIPNYRILGAMLQRASGKDSLITLKSSIAVMSDRFNTLSQRYGVDLQRRIGDGIAAGDRNRVVGGIALAGLFEASNLATAIGRDELTGWATAKRNATISYLTYLAVDGPLKARYPKQRAKVGTAFALLISRLKRMDLTTPHSSIDEVKRGLLNQLKGMAALVTAADSSGHGEP